MADKTRLYLIDGSGYIFRAFYAVAPLTNSEGFPTNGLYGFMRMLLPLLKEIGNNPVALIFDAGKDTFRTEMYKEYKANRTAPPPELVQQFPYFRHLGVALGFPVLELKGFEADDIIGTFVSRATTLGLPTTVISADKDLLQLVSDEAEIEVRDPMKQRVFHEKEVIEKFGVPPAQVTEILALIGDSSDNIPGLDGVGPKTALQLIERFKTVEQLLANPEAVAQDESIRGRQKIAERLTSNADIVRMSRRLVEIHREVPLSIARSDGSVALESLNREGLADSLRLSAPTHELKELIEKFGFDSLLEQFDFVAPAQGKSEKQDSASEQNIIVTPERWSEFLSKLKSQTQFAFDTETTSLDVLSASLVGMSFAFDETTAYYIPCGHRFDPSDQQIPLETIKKELAPVFADAKRTLIGQNVKYDLEILGQAGIAVSNQIFDTMIAAHLLNPDRGSNNLTVLAQIYLHESVIEFEEVLAGKDSFELVPISDAARYAAQDARLAWKLREVLQPLLEKADLLSVFKTVEMPLVPVLAALECRGLVLDVPFLQKLSREFSQRLATLEQQVYGIAGGTFNINSPKQLSEILFNRLNLPTKGLKKTKTGISTDQGVLEKLATEHPLPKILLEYRSLHKLRTTYVDTLPAQISARTGRLHTKLNQTGTATGRLSSSEPNLQNIPIQTEEGRRIRESFISAPGTVLLSADYSQIELRVLAHLCGDEALQEAFRKKVDIHSATAREILRIPEGEPVTSEARRMGKTINFGIVYGMGAFRLSKELEIPFAVATEYIEGYFARFPGVRRYFDGIERAATETGFVSTICGRKRFLNQISGEGRDQSYVRRAALNAPIQGSAADIMKLAMIAIERRLVGELSEVRMLLQVHDELLFEVPERLLSVVTEEIRKLMEGAYKLAVPLVVDIGHGRTWEEAHS